MNIAELLEKSRSISIVLPVQARAGDWNDAQEALSLACGFKKLGKQVSLVRPSSLSQSSPGRERAFVVSLKGLAPWVAKVRYEKDTKDLRLYFTLNEGNVPQEAFSVQIQNPSHLTIIVGDSLPHGNAGDHFQEAVVSSREAKEFLLNLLSSREDLRTRLLGKVLAKMQHIASLDTYLITLQEEDFKDGEIKPKHFPMIIPELRESFGDNSSYLFLLNLPQGTQALLWSLSDELRKKFRNSAGGQSKGPWVLFGPAPLSSEQLKYAFLS